MADEEKSDVKPKRVYGRPFEKGKEGGPGRPKMLEELRIRIREMTHAHFERLCEIAATGEHKDSTAAIKLLWAYGYGHPPQVIASEDGKPMSIGLIVLPEQKLEQDSTD